MTTAIGKLKRASFAGIEFPYTKCDIKGGLRDHVHEFPHVHGGKPEKLGRRLYEVSFDTLFLQNLRDPKWDKLWPENLGKLRRIFEQQKTEDLHVPTVGTIRAYCREWGQTTDPAKIRSGEIAAFQFREDTGNKFLVEGERFKIGSINVSMKRITKLTFERELRLSKSNPTLLAKERRLNPSPWDRMVNAVNDVLAVLDQAQLYSYLLESKIRYLIYLCDEADRRLEMFKDPSSYVVLNALKDLWASVQNLLDEITGQQSTTSADGASTSHLRSYIVPAQMTAVDIAVALYGSAERATDIINLNALQNPMTVPAGTSIRYFT